MLIINIKSAKVKRNRRLWSALCVDWSILFTADFSIEFTEFKNEVMNKVRRFITELKDINPELLKTKMVLELSSKLSLIRNT